MKRALKSNITFFFILIILLAAGVFQVYRFSQKKAAEKKFNAGDELTRRQDFLNANINYIEGLKMDRRSARVPQVLYILASNYIALTSYGQAVAEYEALAKEFPYSERTEDAQFMIGMVYKNCIGDREKAVAGFKRYLDTYPAGRMRDEVRMYLREYGIKIPK